MPSVGFAIAVDRLVDVLPPDEQTQSVDEVIGCDGTPDAIAAALAYASAATAKGRKVDFVGQCSKEELDGRGVKVTILNRTLSRAEKIAQVNICSFDRLDNCKAYEGQVDLIVQTTTVGYDSWANPIEGFAFTGREICYDILTKPKMTKFLSDAQAAGCSLHFGQEMLIAQGKLQFEAFTGYHYPAGVAIDLDAPIQ